MMIVDRTASPDLGEARILHPGPLRWLRALVWMVLLFVLVAITTGITVSGLTVLLPEGDTSSLIANAVGSGVGLLVYVLLVLGGEGRSPSELALAAAPRDVLAGLILGTGRFAAIMALMAIFGLYDFVWKGPAAVQQALSITIQSGVVEETLFRAVVLRLVWRAFGPWVAFALSAALFGALHLSNPNATPFAALCIAVEAGIMLGAFYALTGRIWVSIGVHAAWNFTQGYLFGAAVSGTDFGPALATSTARAGFPVWLTGGAFGPEASLPGLVVGTGVGLGVLWLAWKAGRLAPPTRTQAAENGAAAPG
jgi:membrane protease YdiL (CAAX protease family)